MSYVHLTQAKRYQIEVEAILIRPPAFRCVQLFAESI
jgi:hypothetical protein